MISPPYHLNFADGNIGAKSFLLSLERYSETEPEKAQKIWDKIQELKLKGWKLWVLFSDISKQDFEKLFDFCSTVPGDVLIEAVSKGDYSGLFVINQYFNKQTLRDIL